MKLAIIGTGYVGLVSGTCFAEMGSHVVCVDNDPGKLQKLQQKKIPIYEPGLEVLFIRNIEKKKLSFTGDLRSAVLDAEIIFLCLPTPQGEDGSADLQYVLKAAEDIGKIIGDSGDTTFRIIVNKSTVPVGTSHKVETLLKKQGLTNFAVVSNPEFVREGLAVEDFMRPDRIIIGSRSERASQIMRNLYEPFVRQGNPILFMDNESAEVTKYAANSYLATRITFMNEIANFCEVVGADVDLVRRGMGTDSRIGKRFLFPGIGYGGSCFPKDVNALLKTSKDNDKELRILSVIDKINKEQKLVLVTKILNHFNGNIQGKLFAVWGLAFKPNTDDMREAPSIYIIKKLLELGATVSAYDPAAMETAQFYFKDTIKYAADEYDALTNADALLLLTEWNEFRNPDFSLVRKLLKQPVIFDGRNIFQVENMEKENFTYYSVGRRAIK
jgi:UDPglucose 6-dehydrogenase